VPTDQPADRHPLWAERLADLVAAWRAGAPLGPGARAASGLPEEAWLLLRTALLGYIAGYAGVAGGGCPEEIQDLASQKTLELVQRITAGSWNPANARPAGVAAYVRAVARNGLRDLRRRDRRSAAGEDSNPEPVAPPSQSPVRHLEARDFARALAECVACLDARTRLVWLLRALHELPSRRIAEHPRVALSPGHVDVLLHRARHRVRVCMEAKGFPPQELPATVMLYLWRRFHREAETVPAVRRERRAHG